jgi:hypothetical protein
LLATDTRRFFIDFLATRMAYGRFAAFSEKEGI